MTMFLSHTTFSHQDILATQPALKVGMLATVNPDGLPHITLISSLKAASESTVTFGQFTEGLSKQHVRHNPRTGFMIMTMDKVLWRGKANWTHSTNAGPEYEWYNNIPMFRYNAYFGIHTVHFLELVGQTGAQPLPMSQIIPAAVKTMLANRLAPTRGEKIVMNDWTRKLFNTLDALKFMAYIDQDGFPCIIPIIQAQADGAQRLRFSASVYTDELRQVPHRAPVAVLGMALSMEDVLVRGTYLGIQRSLGMQFGSLEVDWVYNPMPPVPGQIYPQQPLTPVTEF